MIVTAYAVVYAAVVFIGYDFTTYNLDLVQSLFPFIIFVLVQVSHFVSDFTINC